MLITEGFALHWFMEQFYEQYLKLFEALNIPFDHESSASQNVAATADTAVEHWLTKEMRSLVRLPPKYSPDQVVEALPHLLATGLFSAAHNHLPDDCDRVVYISHKFETMLRVFRATHQEACKAGQVLCAVGENVAPRGGHHYRPELRLVKKAIEESYDLDHTWINQQWALGEKAFATDYELATMALLCACPGARVLQAEDGLTTVRANDRLVTIVNVTPLRHASPVGYGRLQLLMHRFPVEPDAKVAIASCGPSTLRMAVQGRRKLAAMPDMQGVQVHSFGGSGADTLLRNAREAFIYALAELAYLAMQAVEDQGK